MFIDIPYTSVTSNLIKDTLTKCFKESKYKFNADKMTLNGKELKGGVYRKYYDTIVDNLCQYLNLQKKDLSKKAKEFLEVRLDSYETLFKFYTKEKTA